MTAAAINDRLAYESRVGVRQAVVAVAAGVLLIVAAALQLAGPHANVSELTLGLIIEHKRFALDLVGAVLEGLGWLAVAWTLTFLFGAVRARDSQAQAFIRYTGLAGAPLAAAGIIGYITAYGITSHKFITEGSQTYPEANHLMSAGALAAFQIMDYAGELLLAVAFVLISMQAMRVGLLTRFMGYLGIIAGILVLFVITPVPIVQAYWLAGLGVLFAGRWPTGTPPSWRSGRIERWPSSQELREQRMRDTQARQRSKSGSKPSPEPVATVSESSGARAPRSGTPKRKRKRRK